VRVDSRPLCRLFDTALLRFSLVAKLIVNGSSRNECLMRLRRSLEEFVIGGIDTTIPLHRRIIGEQAFIDGDYDIHWLEKLVGLKK
jgi:acetyl-CoA carboxylase biotin carboxylase subunit